MLAVASALAFATSGPLAKSLIDTGWSPGAAVIARIGGAALLLLPVVLWRSWPSRGRLVLANARHLVGFGLIALAGVQLGYFSAVQTLPVAVALLIQYSAPMLVVVWLWLARGQRPARLTVIGAAVAIAGAGLVLDPPGGTTIDPVGLSWAVFAACCTAGYFLLAARQPDGLPPELTLGVGLLIGTAALALLAVVGVIAFDYGDEPAVLAGTELPWQIPVLGLVLVGVVLAYLLGIVAARRLGARLASFVALTEVVFATAAALWLLGQPVTPALAIGGALVVLGIGLVRAAEAEVSQGTDTRSPAGRGR